MTHLSVNPNVIPPETPSVHLYVCCQFNLSNQVLLDEISLCPIPGKIPFCSSGSPSVSLSPSAEKPSEFPGNHGEKNKVNYLLKSQ